jgi:hypothetical protein
MSFEQSLATGGYGEHAVWNILTNQPKVRVVVDVRKDKRFQEKDIDFLVENTDQQFTSIEVKTDFKAHETGNIVYEATTSGHIGCFEKTQADYIAYFVPKSKKIYMIHVKALRTYLHQIKPEPVKMGDNATGFLIPLKDLEDNKVIKMVYEGVM